MNAHGKLLLTAEYAILDGVKALAIPLEYGQSMKISGGRGCDIVWESLDENDEKWFKARISLYDFKPLKTTDERIADRLTRLLTCACNLNSDFLSTWKGMKVKTIIDFPRKYGWGTSSTLVYLVAQWAEVDPYELFKKYANGSGYDIACADAEGPIFYQLKEGQPEVNPIDWQPDFMENLYLIYQGVKKNSEDAIATYNQEKSSPSWLSRIDKLTTEFTNASDLKVLEEVINAHESLLGIRLNTEPIKKKHFPDYWGEVKSLGAWGGDFALATSSRDPETTRKYFQEKGYETFIPLESVLLKSETVV